MHFEIRSALQPGKQLTTRQRKSGFSEAPTVAGSILRRGVTLLLQRDMLERNKLQISRLMESESILVTKVEEKKRTVITDVDLIDFEAVDAGSVSNPADGGEGTASNPGSHPGGVGAEETGPSEGAAGNALKADPEVPSSVLANEILQAPTTEGGALAQAIIETGKANKSKGRKGKE
jgi:hypothetical protein